jgi:hypothetical protein
MKHVFLAGEPPAMSQWCCGISGAAQRTAISPTLCRVWRAVSIGQRIDPCSPSSLAVADQPSLCGVHLPIVVRKCGRVSGTRASVDMKELNVALVEFLRDASAELFPGKMRQRWARAVVVLHHCRSQPYRIRRPAATELQDLRDGPVVLIGGFNNPWTLRLGAGLRFTLASDQLRTGDWDHRNVQIVVATKVIGEDSGAPRVIAAHLW